MRSSPSFRSAVSRLQLGLALSCILVLVQTSIAASEDATVPADYAALVPSDAAVVAYIADYDELRTGLGKMAPSMAREGMIPDLPQALVDTSLSIPQGMGYLIWTESLGPIVSTPPTGVFHIAFRLPGANADTVSVKGGDTSLTFKGDMVVLSQDMSHSDGKPTYRVPEKAKNTLVDRLPSSTVSVAILGSDIADQARKVAPMLSMGPMMLQQQMSQRLQALDQDDRAAVRKAQNKAVGDVAQLLKAALASIEDIQVMTMGLDLDGGSLISDIDFSIGGRVADDHGVSPKVLKALPDDMPGYFAFDGPTLEWLANLELDLFEGMMAESKEDVVRFDRVIGSIESVGRNIDGGYAGGFTGSLGQTQGIFGVKDSAGFLKDMSGMMTSLTDLGIGLDYQPAGDMKWTVKMDEAKMMERFGATGGEMGLESGNLGGEYDITMRTADGMVFLDQVRKGAKGPQGEGDPALKGDFESLADSKVVAGLAVDVLGMAREIADSMGTDLPAEMKGKALLAMILHSPDPRTVALHLRLPIGQFIEIPAMSRLD